MDVLDALSLRTMIKDHINRAATNRENELNHSITNENDEEKKDTKEREEEI